MGNNPLKTLIQRYPQLGCCEADIVSAFELLCSVFESHNKLLVAGNGGSASDADHIAGELLKAFGKKAYLANSGLPKTLERRLQHALPVIPLANLHGAFTAYSNDNSPEWAFAQLSYALGNPGDGLWALSTSGNSENILHASQVARAKQMKVLGLTGQSGGQLRALCNVCICVPEEETFKVQELHLPIYHCLCLMLEEHFFGKCP